MLPDRVSNPGPLTYESGALPIALRGPAITSGTGLVCWSDNVSVLTALKSPEIKPIAKPLYTVTGMRSFWYPEVQNCLTTTVSIFTEESCITRVVFKLSNISAISTTATTPQPRQNPEYM